MLEDVPSIRPSKNTSETPILNKSLTFSNSSNRIGFCHCDDQSSGIRNSCLEYVVSYRRGKVWRHIVLVMWFPLSRSVALDLRFVFVICLLLLYAKLMYVVTYFLYFIISSFISTLSTLSFPESAKVESCSGTQAQYEDNSGDLLLLTAFGALCISFPHHD